MEYGTMSYKIIQIIPASKDIRMVYKQKDNELEYDKVICLALVEYEDGQRAVYPMQYINDNFECIELDDEYLRPSNLVDVVFKL